jgi:hypothetical protein
VANLTPDEIDAAYMDYLDNHASHEERVAVGIPVKVNIVSGGSRTAFRSEGEQQSERSDAGMVILESVFGIVKRNCPERSGGRFGGDWGCREKGRTTQGNPSRLRAVLSCLHRAARPRHQARPPREHCAGSQAFHSQFVKMPLLVAESKPRENEIDPLVHYQGFAFLEP